MADAVTSEILQDTETKTVLHLTNLSDGTGEDAVVKLDTSTLKNSGFADVPRAANSVVAISKIVYNVHAKNNDGHISIGWEGNPIANVVFLGDGAGTIDYVGENILLTNSNTESNGNLVLFTDTWTAGSTYTLTIEFKKMEGFNWPTES